ncbi:MAG: DUF5723 family protein [Bacteroidales bacterium]
MNPYLPYRLLLLLGFVLIKGPVSAQQSLTFYQMTEVPQANLLNPAHGIPCSWYLGMPGFASLHAGYDNTFFSAADLMDGDRWNTPRIADRLHRSDLLALEGDIALFDLGHWVGRWDLRFTVREQAGLSLSFDRDLPTLLFTGNGSSIGESVRIDRFSPRAMHFRSYGLGLSRSWNGRTRLGVRTRLLFGKAGLVQGPSRMEFSTSRDEFYLHFAGNYALRFDLPVELVPDATDRVTSAQLAADDPLAYLLNRSNPGLAFDAGVIHRYDEKTTLSASLLDLGFLAWRTQPQRLDVTGQASFLGFDGSTEFISIQHLEELADSLLHLLEQDLSAGSFLTALTPQLFLGAHHQVNEKLRLDLSSRSALYPHKIHTSLSVGAGYRIGEHLHARVAWSWINRSPLNLGAGLAWQGRNLHLHIVSDNVSGFLLPMQTRSLNLRIGAGFSWGCPRDVRNARRDVPAAASTLAGDCSWAGGDRQRGWFRRKTGF